MLFSNHIKQYILFIFFISFIELVKFCLPSESPTVPKNGRNSGSGNSLTPSRHSTTNTRRYVKKELTYRANERRQQILRRQQANRNLNYQRRNSFESRCLSGIIASIKIQKGHSPKEHG
uniref:Secreted protein n=1 Tax=Strongyloides papillosus TaxID=174720 RepID=A0A0N5CIQ7_STREA